MGEQIKVDISNFVKDFNLIERALAWCKMSGGYEDKSIDEQVEAYLKSRKGDSNG